MLRRRTLPTGLLDALEAFHAVLGEVEPAKAGMTDVLPGGRLPGRPLDHALAEFIERLHRAEPLMAAWRRPELDDVWLACLEGLGSALELAGDLSSRQAEPEGFEGLLWTIVELLDLLDPFAAAEERFRALRRRPGRRTV